MLKAHNIEDDSRMNPEFADRLKQLDKEASYYRDECGKAQAEVDRLLEILKEVENEKNDKDKKIAELERYALHPESCQRRANSDGVVYILSCGTVEMHTFTLISQM